jgi:predicted O-methyltransferase YrrM
LTQKSDIYHSTSLLRKGIKEAILHPSILPFAMAHSKKETIARLKQLESLRITPKEAFHNDSILQEFLLSAIDFFKVTTFFETGTFRGDSIIWLANRTEKIRLISCESEAYFYKRALKRLSTGGLDTRIRLMNKSSPTAIRECFQSGILQEPVLFWLDAHWNEYWPLADELREILRWCKKSILLIDDFKVPNDPQMQYDVYDGQENSLEYISPLLHGNSPNLQFDLIFPNYPKLQRQIGSGHRYRGYVTVFFDLRSNLQQFEQEFRKLTENFIHKFG